MTRKTVTLDDIERRHVTAHITPYYSWIRHVVSLSTASLTALIALQGHYLPSHPQAISLLALSWLSLLLTVLSGLVALRSEYATPLAAVKKIREMRRDHGDMYAANQIQQRNSTPPHWSHKWAVRLMLSAFSIGLICLCIFAVINLMSEKN
ncbi:MAG: hypothetical protein AB7C96_07305 [Hydrogenovibrio sp.]